MRNLLLNLAIGVFGTLLSFYLFTVYYPPQIIVVDETEPLEVSAQLVNHKEDLEVNTSPRGWAVNPPNSFQETAEKVTEAVVNITAFNGAEYRVSSGSGVIISSDGFIITNNHVIESGNRIEVTLFNKRNLTAELVGKDPTTDLALLRVKARNLRALRYGDSDLAKIGQWVLAVGNPFNLTSTVTAGIVSAKARNINILRENYSIESFIQTDAVVNPGNSGGALVNQKGELIGINTAIISESGGFEGYSFAIPSNLVKKVIEDLENYGSVQRAILGIGIKEVDDEIAETMDLPSVAGVVVTNVNLGSSADLAGLRKGDVIVAVNGVSTNSVPELQEQIALFRPGDSVKLDYFRRGQKFRLDRVQLQALKENISTYNR